ncbi:MAG TPA: hypothetical protein VGO18_32495 [Steroidobacteraceae bacterium]|nr:hypothetical protein [Steroidobacteraceae bacterium]
MRLNGQAKTNEQLAQSPRPSYRRKVAAGRFPESGFNPDDVTVDDA